MQRAGQAPIAEANQSQSRGRSHDRKLLPAGDGQAAGQHQQRTRPRWRKKRALGGKLSDEPASLLHQAQPQHQNLESDHHHHHHHQQSPLQQNKQPESQEATLQPTLNSTGQPVGQEAISASNQKSGDKSDPRVGQASEVNLEQSGLQAAISRALPPTKVNATSTNLASNQLPLIHTDHFSTSTRLLYVSNPAGSDSAARGQHLLTRQNTLAATFARRRAGHLMAQQEQQQDNMAASASSSASSSSGAAPRLDIVNLEVASNSATLTWSLSWATPEPAARSKRDTIKVRATLDSKRRRQKSEEDAAALDEEEPASELDLEEESLAKDLDRARRRNESRRLVQANTKTSTSTTTSTTSTTTTEKPASDEFALEVEELPVPKKASSGTGDEDEDILRRKQHAIAPVVNATATSRSGATLRPLPAPSGPTKRPPNRPHHNHKHQHNPSNMTTTTSTSTTTSTTTTSKPTTAKLRLPTPTPTSPSNATNGTVATSGQTQKPAATQSQRPAEPEPPMVRVPAVAINRISSTAKPTAAFVNETSPQSARVRERARAKNLRFEDGLLKAAPNGTAVQQAGNETTSRPASSGQSFDATPNNATSNTISAATLNGTATLAPTETSFAMQTQPAPRLPAAADKEASESALKSTVASSTLVQSDALQNSPLNRNASSPPSTQAAASATPPPPSSASTSSSERPIISVTRSELITAEGRQTGPIQAPVRTAKEAPASSQAESSTASLKSNWLLRVRKFGSNEVDIVKISANLADLSERPITRSVAFRMLEPASGYEICVESASPNQLISDRNQILNANHFLKCHDVSELELSPSSLSGSSESEVMRRLDLAPLQVERASSARVKSLCREFVTPGAGSNQTLSFNQLGAGSLSAFNETSGESARRAKALGDGAGPLQPTGSPLKSRVQLMEIGSEQRDGAVFEMLASGSAAASSRGGRSPASAANETGPLVGSRPPMALDSSSLVPIVGCVFLLIFLATLANMVLNLLHCAERPGGRAGASGGLRGSTRRLRQRLRRRSARNRLGGDAAPQVTSGHLQALSPLNSPVRYFNSSERSGSSKARMLIVGAANDKLSEPYGSSSSYFDIPNGASGGGAAGDYNAQHLYGRLLPAGGGLLRVHSAASSPSYAGRAGTPAAASVYALSTAARFPLGPSFEGDEKHNADMVGLARRNYDNFISNIYNADHLAGELANAQLNSARNSKLERDTKRELVIQATTFKHQANDLNETLENDEEKRRSRTAPAKQRIRFDKVNPIYNMDGIQHFSSEIPMQPTRTNNASSQASFAGQSSPNGSSCSSTGANTASTSVEGGSPATPAASCSLCDSMPAAAEQPQQLTWAPNSALDRQKQRFQAQQQQLERVLSKSGQLVPQPFIATPIGGEQPPAQAGQAADSPHSKASFFFGEQQAQASQMEASQRQESGKTPAPAPPVVARAPPTPPPPLSVEASRAASPQDATAAGSKSLPAADTKRPLVQLQETGTIGPPPAQQTQASINKTDFHQRRNELASKLHLAGMSKQQQQPQ